MPPLRLFLTLLLGSACLAVGAQPSSAPAAPRTPPPPEAFFGEGSVQSMQLSPNGRWLASQVVPAGGGRVRLVVSDLQDQEPAQAVAAFSLADVLWFRWVNDELLVAGFGDKLDRGADNSTRGGLVSVTRDGKTMRHLIKATWDNDYPAQGLAPLEGNHFFYALGAPGSEEIVVGAAKVDRAQELYTYTLLTMNARTGARRSLLESAPADTTDFGFDPQGRPRLAVAFREGWTSLHWREPDAAAWRLLARFESGKPPFSPQFIDGDGRLYVSVATADGRGEELRRLDLASGQPSDEVLLATPGYDGGFSPVLDRRTGELVGVDLRLDADERVWFRPALTALQKRVDDRLRGRINRLLCGRCDTLERVLVFSQSDRAPGDYLLFDTKTAQLQRLGQRRPAIDPATMAPVHFERIRARDGRDLPVYVTLPGGATAGARPAVVLVHGGPNVRGRDWSWEADSQFLASRGYVVIEPEFRGSTGFGDAHLRAGFRQWGQAMQTDLDDALEWAVKKGWVDPARVCIAGASYGGYAVLMGLAGSPQRYRCGVSWIGVSDLQLLFTAFWSDVSASAKRHSMKVRVGDPEKDAEMLRRFSPIHVADRVKAPLLLAYGAVDRRVPLEHGDRLREALVKAGNKPEWVVYPNEGHGWRLPETARDFWTRVETFLARELAPGAAAR